MVRVRVKGIDSETNEPIPFARVEFWRPGDKRPFMVSSTDEEGVAEYLNKQAGAQGHRSNRS